MAVKKIGTLNKHQNPATNENQFDIENYMNVNWDKIKEVVDNNADELTTTQGKVTTLETDNTKNKQDISDIKENQETQNDLLQRTQSALINITTEKSDCIHVEDSSNLTAKIDVYGTSSQKTRSGKNKFNVSNLSGSSIADKDFDTSSFILQNSWANQVMSNSNLIKNIKPSTQYICTADVTLLEKPDNLKENSNNNILLKIYKNGTSLSYDVLKTSTKEEKDNWQVNTTKKFNVSFTTPSDLTDYRIIGYTYYTSDSQVAGKFKIENMMIREATENDEFEIYGASPSPEYLSEIENVTGDINVITTNENLAVADWAERFVNVVNNNSKARLEETDGRKCLFYNADAGYQNDDAYFFKYIFKKNTRYVISFYIKPSTMQGNFAIKYTDGSMGSVQNLIAGEWQKVVIYTKTNATVEEVCVQYLSGNCRIDLDTIQITEGTTEKEYIKNQGQTITFPLQEGQRLADGDKLGDDGIHHKRKQIELNGTENWIKNVNYSTETILAVQLRTSDAVVSTSNTLCNFFKYNSDNTTANTYRFAGNYLLIKLDVSEFSTIEAFKTWLAEQKAAGTPVVVEYELATEEIEQYTPEQQKAYDKLQNVLSYKTVTNVFTDNAEVEMNYIADTKTYVDNEINSIKNQLNTINELLSTTTTSAMLLDNMQSDLESEVL